ncbi:MAG: cyanophycinase [Blastocatellia bacterium]
MKNLLAASLLFLFLPVVAVATQSGYEYHIVGNQADAKPRTSAGLMLMGGSTDVATAFQWMIEKSGGGDFVVIRASGTEAYNPYINSLGKVDSVETIIFKSRAAASDEFVLNRIRNAEALFIAGGDQFNYVKFWQDTPVEDAINQLARKGVPVGGTSAGLAVMGEFFFSARNDTVTSTIALADPFDSRVQVERGFLAMANLSHIITDSHFVARDRMGRLVAFLARIVRAGWTPEASGLGIDEKTAVIIEPDGTASIRGSGAAYFLRTQGKPEKCVEKNALTFRNLSIYRIRGTATFNLSNWTGAGGTSYTLSSEAGVLSSSAQRNAIY